MNNSNYFDKINKLIQWHVFVCPIELLDFARNCDYAYMALTQFTNKYSVDIKYFCDIQNWHVELFDRRTCKGASANTLPLAICLAILSLLNVPYRDI